MCARHGLRLCVCVCLSVSHTINIIYIYRDYRCARLVHALCVCVRVRTVSVESPPFVYCVRWVYMHYWLVCAYLAAVCVGFGVIYACGRRQPASSSGPNNNYTRCGMRAALPVLYIAQVTLHREGGAKDNRGAAQTHMCI